MKKVLVLTAAIGGGHISTADGIHTFALHHRTDYQVDVVDILEFIRPVLSKIAGKSYEINAKSFPELYRWIYDINNATEGKLTKNNLSLFYSKIKELIDTYKPDVVVCTHPVAISNIIKTRKRYGYNYKVAVLITDYDYHTTWVDSEADLFFVASQYMKFKLLADKIHSSKIQVTGIPTSLKMLNRVNKQEARNHLGLKDKATLLAMGGSFGAGKLKKIMIALGESDLNIQAVFISGKNKRTKRILTKLSQEYNKDWHVIGFTDQISLYMDAADYLLTKPGGLTVTEALIKQIPIIMNKPIPGQEEENATFILNKGMGVKLNKETDLAYVIKDLMEDPLRISYIKQMQAYYCKPNAAADMFRAFDELLPREIVHSKKIGKGEKNDL